MHQVIRLHVQAPPKPEHGAPCNGCGVCCASEPCPVGIVVSGRWRGACAALSWNDAQGRYVCAVLQASASARLHRWVPAWGRWVRRRIAAGTGCDCSLAVVGVEAAGRRD